MRGTRSSTGSPKSGTGRPGNRRWDICPEHAPLERAELKTRKAASAARKEARDAIRKLPMDQRIEARKARAKSRRKTKRDAAKAVKP